jgi:hypothetical protein
VYALQRGAWEAGKGRRPGDMPYCPRILVPSAPALILQTAAEPLLLPQHHSLWTFSFPRSTRNTRSCRLLNQPSKPSFQASVPDPPKSELLDLHPERQNLSLFTCSQLSTQVQHTSTGLRLQQSHRCPEHPKLCLTLSYPISITTTTQG